MDERTRTTDDDLAPNLRRTAPLAPEVESQPRSKFRTVLGLIIAAALVVGAYEFVHTVRSPAPTSSRTPVGGLQAVGGATIGQGNIRVLVNALGTVTPLATVTVQSQISGYLTQVGFTEGQMVQKDDFLAQIDPRPYEALKAQYEGQLAHDQGLLNQAKMDLTRYQTLAQQNSIARQQAEDQVYIVQQYEGSVKQDQALIDAQSLNLAYCHILSPVTGRVGLRLVDPGNYVQTSSTTGIAVVTQLQPITVVFSIPEDDLPDIMPQLTSGATLAVTAFDRANVKQLAKGSVAAVDNQIDTTTGTVKVKAQFDNTDYALFPNQFVNAQLLVKTLQNVVTVPTAAIQRGSPGTYVYALSDDGTVSVRQIKIGPTDGTLTAVESGLKAGDHVVVDGSDRLRDGIKVNITEMDGKPVTAKTGSGQDGQGGQNGNSGRRRSGAAGGANGGSSSGTNSGGQ